MRKRPVFIAGSARIGRPVRATMAAAAALLVACHPAPHVVLIGLGYHGYQRIAAVAALIADSLDLPAGRSIRIVSDVSATMAQASAQAGEVEHAIQLAAMAGIAGVVGHGGSREALLTAPIYNEAHVPQIVPTGTSRRLRNAGPWTFMLAPDDSMEGEFLGRFVSERLRARSVTVFYTLDEYGAGLRDGAVAALVRRGVRVLDAVPVPSSSACAPKVRTNMFAPAVDAALLRGIPDVVLLAARQGEAGCIVARVHQQHPRVAFVAGDGLLPNDLFRSRAGSAADSLYVAAFWYPGRPDSVSRAFVRRYQRLYGAEPTHEEAMIYDALCTLLEAVRTVGPDAGRVRGYLMSLGHARPALHGVTGLIRFPGSAERLTMMRVRGDGRTSVVAE